MPRGFQVQAASIAIVDLLTITTVVLRWLLHFREGVASFRSSNPIKIFSTWVVH